MSAFVEFSTQTSNPANKDVMDIDPKELTQKKGQVYLVDVRHPDEYWGELGHIPGSQLLTLDLLPQQIDELPKDKTIVFICRSGGRSGQATQFAKDNGFKHVFNLKGGMLLWNELNLETQGQPQN